MKPQTSRKFFRRSPLVCAIFAQAILLGGAFGSAFGAVNFPHPGHMVVLPANEGGYDVRFTWEAPPGATTVTIAGTFNGWNPLARPMERLGESNTWVATVTLGPGEHLYKFVADGHIWRNDPLNPVSVSDGMEGLNSVLRLGVFAALHGKTGTRGDGEIEASALLHNPAHHTYLDPQSGSEAFVRYRTFAHDVEEALLVLVDRAGGERALPMHLVGGDALFDFHEYHLTPADLAGDPPVVAYTFETRDAETIRREDSRWPLLLDERRVVRVPEWAKGAVWYQILVDRFRDGDPSNNPEYTLGTGRIERTNTWTADHKELEPWERQGDRDLFSADGNRNGFPDIYERLYGGDFQGVIDRMDYLAGLGITAIYFNPVFEATSAHKYNGKTFVHADDGYGRPGEFARASVSHDPLDPETWIYNDSDLKFLELVDAAHARGIRVVLDGVFNHMGDQAPIFQDVLEKGRDSRYADWFAVTNWEPFEYDGWGGFSGLPEFRKSATGLESESVVAYINGITERWMRPMVDGVARRGIDGWRLDAAEVVPLPFWQTWRETVKEINPDAVLVGEIWWPAEEWLDGTSFDATMNYPFRNVVLDFFGNVNERVTATEFQRRLGRLMVRYPWAVALVQQNLLDSHDTDRIASRLMNPDLTESEYYDGGNSGRPGWDTFDDSRPSEDVYRRLKLVALFQYTWVGSPMTYYGTEVGMYGADDPLCRKPMWWEDLMPYDNPDYRIHEGLHQWYTRLGQIRANNIALRVGDYTPLIADDAQEVFAFSRRDIHTGQRLVVFLNNGGAPAQIETSASVLGGVPDGGFVLAFDGVGIETRQDGRVVLSLPPVSGAVLSVSVNQSTESQP